jgi:hypothetical protein
MMRLALALVLLPGCCWFAKRDCFPPCPPHRHTVVTVEKLCQLPPKLKLEVFERTDQGCPADLACYDRGNAAKLAKRLAEMKDWILEARRRCTPAPSSQPSSQPTSRPANP